MTTIDPMRAIEDRLLRLETKFDDFREDFREVVATKADVSEAKLDLLRWYVTVTLINGAALTVMILGSIVLNHFWK